MILYNTNMITLARIANKIRKWIIAAIRIGFQVIAATFMLIGMCASVIIKILNDIEDE
jgi:hypothetical protein